MLNEEISSVPPKENSMSVAAARNELRAKRVELVVRCQEIVRYLRGFEELAWADWLESVIDDISLAKPDSVQRLLDGYCGIGNISDVFLCPEAGHRVAVGDENAINHQYLLMLSKVNELARQVLTLSTPFRARRSQ